MMMREKLERKLAKLIAHYDACMQNDYFVGPFKELKKYILKEEYDWSEKWKLDNYDINQFKKDFSKENNLKTEDDWINYFIEHFNKMWFSSEKEFAQCLIDDCYFCDLSDEELMEQYNSYKKAR